MLEAAGRRVRRTPGNLNNHIGLPLSILALEPADEALVVEMGMNHEGEIDHLARIADPTVGAITNVAPAHLGLLGSIEAIARAKGELFARMRGDGHRDRERRRPALRGAVARASRVGSSASPCAASAEFRARRRARRGGRAAYTLECPGGAAEIRMRVPGLHLVEDGLCAAAAALRDAALLGVAPARGDREGPRVRSPACPAGSRCAKTAGGLRRDRRQLQRESALGRRARSRRSRSSAQAAATIAVLGDMFELGDDEAALHAEVGRAAAASGVDVLIAVGPLSRHTAKAAREAGLARALEAASADDAAALVRAHARAGDVVLVKASRGMKLERVVRDPHGDPLMLYHLFYELLSSDISGLNVFRYLTFRSVGAALTALLIAFIAGPWLIRELEDRQIGQTIREDTPDRHQGKRGTPTMGGVLILVRGGHQHAALGRVDQPVRVDRALRDARLRRDRLRRRLPQGDPQEPQGHQRAREVHRPVHRRGRSRRSGCTTCPASTPRSRCRS